MSDQPAPIPDPPEEPQHRGLIPREDLDFLPRVRWRIWGPVIAVLVLFPTIWLTLRHRELVRLRDELVREHTARTADFAPAYRGGRERIEGLIMLSLGAWEGDHRDPSLTWEALSREPVLYARTRLGEIHGRADLAASIRHRYADQILACMGLQFAWARELLDKGAFLLPAHVEEIRNADTPERVQALRADMRLRVRRDREAIERSLGLRYFLLAVDEAPLSIDGPTRVYVYDLRDGRQVLRARGTGDGLVLVPFRIAGLPAPPPTSPRGRAPTVSQHDCAVANDVRAVIGIPRLGMGNVPDPPAPTTDAAGAPADAPSTPDRTNPPHGT